MTESVHPVLAAAATYRQQLLRQEDAAVRRLVQAYGTAYQRMGAQIQALQQSLDGQPIPFGKAARLVQLQALRQQIETEIGRFGVVADNELTQVTRQAIQLGLNHSTGLVDAYFTSPQAKQALSASFTQLVPEQVETLLGFLAPDSPLHTGLVNQLGASVAERVSSNLVDGMVRGFNPNKTAAIVRRELGVGLAWAVNTTRTANLWAYREATRANYAANPRVVSGWTWLATLDRRVCGNCLSQHGSKHGLNETLNGHNQCRCTMIPELPLAKSLGLDLPEIEPGEQWFSRQPEAMQRDILGPGMLAAWKAGDVSFNQFRHTYQHPAYGTMQRMPSMKDLGLPGGVTRVPAKTPERQQELVPQSTPVAFSGDMELLPYTGFSQEDIARLFDIGTSVNARISIRGTETEIEINGKWLDANTGDEIGEAIRTLFPNEKKAHLDALAFEQGYIGNGMGMKVARNWFAALADAGYDEAELYAGLTVGRYAWAKEGARYLDPTQAARSTMLFRQWIADRGISLADNEYPTFTNVLDVATWKHPRGETLTGKDIKNRDVPADMVLPLGKAFMLDVSFNGHGGWNGVIDLTARRGK